MGSYINGYGKPRFRITDTVGATIEVIDLPYCNVQGMSENYQKLFKTHELQSRELVNFGYKGERIKFSLDYSQFLQKPDSLLVSKIENYLSNFINYKIFFYPRLDNLSRFFEVTLPTDYGYTVGIYQQKQNAPGNKGILPTVITKFAVNKNWQDPDSLSFQSPYQII